MVASSRQKTLQGPVNTIRANDLTRATNLEHQPGQISLQARMQRRDLVSIMPQSGTRFLSLARVAVLVRTIQETNLIEAKD